MRAGDRQISPGALEHSAQRVRRSPQAAGKSIGKIDRYEKRIDLVHKRHQVFAPMEVVLPDGIENLPAEILRDRGERRSLEGDSQPAVQASYQAMFDRMLTDGVSFWSEVYEPFMARDLTRREVRELIRLGLEHTRGNYKLLVSAFNMPPDDYKKFLNFLRKYQCHVPFQRFRMAPVPMQRRAEHLATA